MTYDFYFKNGLVIKDLGQGIFDFFRKGLEDWTRAQTIKGTITMFDGFIRVDQVIAIMPSGTKVETPAKKGEK